jgi:hypothetical protein
MLNFTKHPKLYPKQGIIEHYFAIPLPLSKENCLTKPQKTKNRVTYRLTTDKAFFIRFKKTHRKIKKIRISGVKNKKTLTYQHKLNGNTLPLIQVINVIYIFTLPEKNK